MAPEAAVVHATADMALTITLMAGLTTSITAGRVNQPAHQRQLLSLIDFRDRHIEATFQQDQWSNVSSPLMVSFARERSAMITASVDLIDALITGPPTQEGYPRSMFANTNNVALALVTPCTLISLGRHYTEGISKSTPLLQDPELRDTIAAVMKLGLKYSSGATWRPPLTGGEASLLDCLASIGDGEMLALLAMPAANMATLLNEQATVRFIELLLCVLSKQLSYLPLDAAFETSRLLNTLHMCLGLHVECCHERAATNLNSPILAHLCKQVLCESSERQTVHGKRTMSQGHQLAETLLSGIKLIPSDPAFSHLQLHMSGLTPVVESVYLRQLSLGTRVHEYTQIDSALSVISDACSSLPPPTATSCFQDHDGNASCVLSVLRVAFVIVQQQQKPLQQRQQTELEQKQRLGGVSIDRTKPTIEMFSQALPQIKAVQAAYDSSVGVRSFYVMPALTSLFDHPGVVVGMETALRSFRSGKPDTYTSEEWFPAGLTTTVTAVILGHLCGVSSSLPVTLQLAKARVSLVATLQKLRMLDLPCPSSAQRRITSTLCLDVLESIPVSPFTAGPNAPTCKDTLSFVLDEFATVVGSILTDEWQDRRSMGLGWVLKRVMGLGPMGGARTVMLALLSGGEEKRVPTCAQQGVAWAESVKASCPLVKRCGYLGCDNFNECCETVLPTKLCSVCRAVRFCGLKCQWLARDAGQHTCKLE